MDKYRRVLICGSALVALLLAIGIWRWLGNAEFICYGFVVFVSTVVGTVWVYLRDSTSLTVCQAAVITLLLAVICFYLVLVVHDWLQHAFGGR